MIEPEAKHWLLPQAEVWSEIKARLKQHFQLVKMAEENRCITFFDDDDWHLWQAEYLFFHEQKNIYTLTSSKDHGSSITTAATPKFYWETPQGSTHDTLKRLIKLRALQAIGELVLHTTRYQLVNKHKVIAQLQLTVNSTSKKAKIPSSTYIGLLVFDNTGTHEALIVKTLGQSALQSHPAVGYRQQLLTLGLKPSPAATTSYGLSESMPAEDAVRLMANAMFNRAIAQERGVITDTDTEFLHHYRVSLRKTRSLINLMKKCLPIEAHQQLKTQLSQLAKPTNLLRDLDVFILNRTHHQNLLPPCHTQGFNHLFDHIQSARASALSTVIDFFQSDRYTTSVNELKKLLQQPPSYQRSAAVKPIVTLSKKRLLKRYKRICELGVAVNNTTPDEKIHKLRIECKKLRYLMEFFAELFEEKPIEQLKKSLKSLQTILGDFNDYSVQKTFLVEQLQKHDNINSNTQAAIDCLLCALDEKQRNERTKIYSAFAKFSSANMAKKFIDLFATSAD